MYDAPPPSGGAGAAAKRSPQQFSPRGGGRLDLTDLAMIVLAATALLAVAAPAVGVAVLVWAVLRLLRVPRLLPALVVLAALPVALLWAFIVPDGPLNVLGGYLDAQTRGLDNLDAMMQDRPTDWAGYLLALGPYVAVVGLALGAALYVAPLARVLAAKHLGWGKFELETAIKSYGATDLRRRVAKEKVVEYIAGFCALGRITAVPSLPKRGKSKALAGLMRASHDASAWFGRFVTKGLRFYVASEEDQATFSGKLNDFDLGSATVVSTHLPDLQGRLGPEKWEGLTTEMYEAADKNGTHILVWDTLTSWAPWAFRGAEHMSFCLSVLKRKSQKYKKGTIVVLHNRKSGGDDEVVAMLGSIAGAAAYDVIAAFDRDKPTGICSLNVTGRLGEWEAQARLDGVQYKPVDPEDKGPDPDDAEDTAPTVGQAALIVAIKAAGRGLTQKELSDLVQRQQSGVSRDLKRLVTLGLVASEGRGVEGDPKRYRIPQEGEAVPDAPQDPVASAAAQSVAPAQRAVAARRPKARGRATGRAAAPPE